MHAQGFDLELKEFLHGWSASFYPTGIAQYRYLRTTSWATDDRRGSQPPTAGEVSPLVPCREMADRPNRDIEQLYTVTPSEFIPTRNAIAARLRAADHTAQAAEVKRLRKPTPAVWVINQIVRQDREGVRRFLDAVGRLRRAHLRGGGETADAIEEHRSALHQLVNRANRIVTTAGLRWSAEMAQRISMTLVGAAADSRSREDLRQGRLREEHSAPGFEALAGTPTPLRVLPGGPPKAPEKPKAKGKNGRRPDRKEIRSTREGLRRAREARRVAERESRRWTGRAEELEQAAARHARAADRAERTAGEVMERLRELQQTVAQERHAAEQATREAQRAREDAKQATERAEAAWRAVKVAETPRMTQ